MAVTIIKRPQGYILDSTANNAQIYDSSGAVMFRKQIHGLSTGDYVFISSVVDDYNGFWYLDVVDADYFRIREYATASNQPFITTFSAVATYYKVYDTHGWSCVHLPIVYKISNDKWPTNSVDTVRTISSIANNNGFCKLTVSGDIRTASPPDDLDFVEIQTGTLAGIYQIVELISNTVFTINLVYTSANATELSSKNIQYYYNNYKVRVKVWAGVNSWASLKAYENIVELELTPDQDNFVEVNINEYLKQKIKVISNNLLLATLPNDIDSFTEFFIETTEAYDESDNGNLLTTYVASYASDQSNFEGVAVNSSLQFKNRHSGYLSDYIIYSTTNTLVEAKFLTLFEEPKYFIGSYYDLSFLMPYSDDYYVQLETYKDSVLQATSLNVLSSYGVGLYRYPISLPSGSLEDRIDVTIQVAVSIQAFDSWTNLGSGTSWTQPGGPGTAWACLGLNIGDTSKYLVANFSSYGGNTYAFDFKWEKITSSGTGASTAHIALMDSDGNILVQQDFAKGAVADQVYTESVSLLAPSKGNRIIMWVDSFTVNNCNPEIQLLKLQSSSYDDVTETITINIDSECSFQDIYLTWKNYLGGMDYWKFTAQKDYIAEIEGTTETTENIFSDWPNSYGEFADTIDKETSRTSRDKIVVRSQNMTESEMNAVRYIVSSPLVQILVSRSDRRTVKVSKGSFTWKRDEDKLYSIEFEISYTNTIPSQSL